MNRIIKSISAVIILMAAVSCDNDIHLCDEWSEKTIVYGMLDVADTNTYLHITKAILGDGNAYDMAKIVDSSEYLPGEITVKMEKWLDGKLERTYNFEPERNSDKQPGVFYSPEHLVYKCNTLGQLIVPGDSTNNYKSEYDDAVFKIIVVNTSGDTVTAETKLVEPNLYVTVSRLHENPTIYKNLRFPTAITWNTATNAERYNLKADLSVLEVMKNGDSILRVIPRGNISNKTASSLISGDIFTIDDHPDGFFAFIEDNVPYSDKNVEDNVLYRKIRLYTLNFSMAGIEFEKYLQTTRGTSISQNQNVYSNVKNGYGLVSSRASYKFPCQVSEEVKKELFENSKYDYLKFSNEE